MRHPDPPLCRNPAHAHRARLAHAQPWYSLGAAALAWLACACSAAPGAAAVGQHTPSPLPGAQLRLALGPVASVVYEPRRLPAPQPLADVGAAAPSLGLEFKAPATHDGPRALLRVQLSTDAALQFRPRRGGLAVSYRAQF